ncbi:hypothetical protein CBS11350_11066 [Aspergillus niger]|nr:hypothetical protein CBS11350_11066 [Aspergillus niger]
MAAVNDLLAPFKLEIRDFGDRRREITYEPGACEGTKIELTTLWTRKRYFTHKNTVYKNVYLDENVNGQLRVVKEILHQPGSDRNRCSELEAAARIARDVGPEYTRLFVEFQGWFEIRNGVSLVLEYCALGDIDQFFPERVPENVARTVAGQLLEGISVLHCLGIAHRDIKPQNVLVAQADPIVVKIADFGVSKYTADRSILRSRVGTPEYMAPELLFGVAKESDYSNAVDIWSLGSLLYYLLSKQLAFPELQMLNAFYQGHVPFPEPPLFQLGVGSSGRSFIRSLMCSAPEDRPNASKDLLEKWEIQADHHQTMEESIPGIDNTGLVRESEGQAMTSIDHVYVPSIAEVPMDYVTSELFDIAAGPKEDIRRTRGLLESNANPSAMRNGHTALHKAARQGFTDTVRLLLGYGADTLIRTQPYDETALHLATYRGDSDAFIVMLDLLAAHGVDINAQDATGNTALHLAIVRLSRVEAVELLLERGARTDLLGRSGLTPLQYAITLDRETHAKELLDRGADPNVPSPDGRRPLHRAIMSGQISLQLIEQLVMKGAEVNAMDDEGVPPLHAAIRQGRSDVVRFLVEKGADTSLGSATMERRLKGMLGKQSLPWPLRK